MSGPVKQLDWDHKELEDPPHQRLSPGKEELFRTQPDFCRKMITLQCRLEGRTEDFLKTRLQEFEDYLLTLPKPH